MGAWPITGGDVRAFLGAGSGASTTDTAATDAAAQAVVAWVGRNVLGLTPDVTTPETVDDDVRLGAMLLAGRWAGRRQTTQGIASFGEFGPAYVRRNDPDVSTLLGLDRPVAT